MTTEITASAAARQYTAAHAVHYAEHDLCKAMEAYNQIIVGHPDSIEAGYSLTQIRNIVTRVVPKAALLAAEMGLVLQELKLAGEVPTTL